MSALRLEDDMVNAGFTRERAREAVRRFPSSAAQAWEWLCTAAHEPQPPPPPTAAAAPARLPVHASSEDDEMQRAIQASIDSAGMQAAAGEAGGDGTGGEDAAMQQVLIDSMQQAAAQGGGGAFALGGIADVRYAPPDMVKPDAALPAGLRNVGNTCYVNTFLQLYYNMRPFRDLILRASCEAGSFLRALQQTFVRMEHSEEKFVDPRCVLQLMKNCRGEAYKVGSQEDVAEFNDTFLSNVEEGMREQKAELRALHALVEGSTTETYRVPTDRNYVKQKTDQYRTVVLPVAKGSETLFDLIDAYTEVESMHGYRYEIAVEAAVPPADGDGDEAAAVATEERVAELATKSVLFQPVPPTLLVFQLQRAEYQGGVLKKNNQRVSFPRHLEMSRYLSENEAAARAVRAQSARIRADIRDADGDIRSHTNVDDTTKSLTELVDIVAARVEAAISIEAEQRDVASAVAVLRQHARRSNLILDHLYEKRAGLRTLLEQAERTLACPGDGAAAGGDSVAKVDGTSYDLRGVIMHEGEGAVSGHYWACLRASDGTWLRFNDTEVSRATDEQVKAWTGEEGAEGAAGAAEEGGPRGTAYCVLYARTDAAVGAGGDVLSPPALPGDAAAAAAASACVAELEAAVREENAAHHKRLARWEEEMARFPPAYDAAAAALAHAEGTAAAAAEDAVIVAEDLLAALVSVEPGAPLDLSLATDPRIVSPYAFALAKHDASDRVVKTLPSVEAYRVCFGGDLLADWQGGAEQARADHIARQTGITEHLYAVKGAAASLAGSRKAYLATQRSLLAVLRSLNAGAAGAPFSCAERQADVWCYVRERRRLEKCWRDGSDDLHSLLVAEFLLRWVRQVCQAASPLAAPSTVYEPLGFIACLAEELPLALRTALRQVVVGEVDGACGQYLRGMPVTIGGSYDKGCAPPKSPAPPQEPVAEEELAECLVRETTAFCSSVSCEVQLLFQELE